MKKGLFLVVLSAVFFTSSLFAEAETAEAVPQKEEAPSEAVKTEPQAEPVAEAAPSEEAKPEEKSGTKTEPQQEEKAEMQSAPESKIEVELVRDAEDSGKELVFSARSLDKMTWSEAQDFCKNLDFYGEEWRLPNIDELRELMRNCPATEPGGSCRVSEEGNCLAGNCSTPKDSCTCERKLKNRGFYSMLGDADYIGLWSSSTLSNDDKKAWGAVFFSGMIGSVGKDAKLYARCVHNSKSNSTDSGDDIYKILPDGKAKHEQALGDDVINEYTGKKMDDFLQCIARGILEDRGFTHGWISLDYIIAPTGEVTSSFVQMSTVGNLDIENCIAKKIREIKFPAPKRASTVFANYSLKFKVKRRKK
ncbi:DUF1566 domain-containing protein [bacterium]|nr:DUF1566 domain-containing protein [bacterium]